MNPWQWGLLVAFLATGVIALYRLVYMFAAFDPRGGIGRHRRLLAGRTYRWFGAWEILIGCTMVGINPGATTFSSALGPILMGLCFLVAPTIKRKFDSLLDQPPPPAARHPARG